jgi:hypothetical protein
MGTTTGSLELTYPASRGLSVTWADSYETNLQTIDTNVTESVDFHDGKGTLASTGATEAVTAGHIYLAPPPFSMLSSALRMQKFTGQSAEAAILLSDSIGYVVSVFGYNYATATTKKYPIGYNATGYESYVDTDIDGSLFLYRGTAYNQATDSYSLIVIYEPLS